MSASALAFAAAALACFAVVDFAGSVQPGHPRIARCRGSRFIGAVVDVFAKAGDEGRDPERRDRLRALVVVACVGCAAAWFFAGVAGGLLAAVAAPAVAARVLHARRERYRAAVEAGAGEIAIVLADALAAGHSLRGAIAVAARSLHGPPGHELKRVAAELELGARTDAALDAMRRRIAGGGIDAIVAGALIQRRAGGDLVRMLRNAARAVEDEQRLLGDVRAATAQARFTGLVVVLLPLGGALLAELASPGFGVRLASSPLSGWLLGMAVALQAGAALAIRRLARVRV